MAFVQKLSAASVNGFAMMFSRQVARPHLALVESVDDDRPRQFQSAGLAFSVPKQARTRAAELQRLQHAMLMQLNKSLPHDAQLFAGSLLPLDAFQNDIGRFLMLACDFYVASPENTFVSPATPEAAEFLGLPFVPDEMPAELISDALSKLQWLRETVASDHRRTAQALQQGDISQLLKSSERKTAYRQNLQAIVRNLAVSRCGSSVWSSHELHFRATIQGL